MSNPIRWMIRRDAPEVLSIDAACYPDEPHTDESLCALLRQPAIVGLVYERGEQVLGYVVYRLEERRLTVLRLGVDPFHSREGIATTLLLKLQSKLSDHRRAALAVDVPETNVAAQLLLRSCGFRLLAIQRGEPDVYQFRFLHLSPWREHTYA